MLNNLCLVLLSIFSNSFLAGPPAKGHLTLSVSNIRQPQGQLLVAVYSSQDGFSATDQSKAVLIKTIPLKSFTGSQDLGPLPFGHYAIMLAYDANGNNKLDRNLLGIPKEGIGVSNGLKSRLRAPKFAECAIDLSRPNQEAHIVLEYL